MRRVLFLITILLFTMITSVLSYQGKKSEVLEYYIKNRYYRVASNLMSQEIIRQLKEKDGMTIREYILEQYFERLLEEEMK